MQLNNENLQIWTQWARRDDWHHLFVGSDIRIMLGEIARLRAELATLRQAHEDTAGTLHAYMRMHATLRQDAERLREVVEEWRAAREAFWAVPPIPLAERFPPDIWIRLGNAEHRLMEIARTALQNATAEVANAPK